MSMSTHVVGFKPPDKVWKSMKAVWDACSAADIPTPEEVMRFFGYAPPDSNGVIIEEYYLEKAGAIKKWKDDSGEGFEVNVSKLPDDVKIIRFYNSW